MKPTTDGRHAGRVERLVMRPLSQYGEDELLDELVRRKNAREKERTPEKWCADCANFETWGKTAAMPESYNPCTKRHKMNFRMPEHESDDDYGFYRRVCADRKDRADVGA